MGLLGTLAKEITAFARHDNPHVLSGIDEDLAYIARDAPFLQPAFHVAVELLLAVVVDAVACCCMNP